MMKKSTVKWTRDKETGQYQSGRFSIVKEVVRGSFGSKGSVCDRVTWRLLLDGRIMEGWGAHGSTLAEVKANVDKYGDRILGAAGERQS